MTENPGKGSLLVIFLTVFVDLLGFGIVIPLLPIYAQDFTTDESGVKLGLLMASFSAMQFVFAPIWGRLSDRIGRRPVIMIGLMGSVGFYTLFGVATVLKSFALLFVARIGAGMAGATISTAQAYIADSTSLANRPKGMALIGVAFGLGFTFGPLLGYLAVPSGDGDPGPGPGYAAAALSAIALALAYFLLTESRHFDRQSAQHAVLDMGALARSLSVPSIGALLVTSFVCVFSFANFETTLSIVIKGHEQSGPFHFSFRQVCLTFAYIGFVLALVQGLLVRKLSGRIAEGWLASAGAGLEIIGFLAMARAIYAASLPTLMLALSVVVAGFALLNPSLNSLISRRSDPDRQGGVLGVTQSVNSLARIVGSAVGIPLVRIATDLPFLVAAALMGLGLALVFWAAYRGQDYPARAL